MKKLATKYFLIINYILSTAIFGFYSLTIEAKDLVLLISIVYLIIFSFKIKKEVLKKFIPIFLLLFLVLTLNVISSYYSYSQDFLYSLRASRIFLIAILLYYLFENFISYKPNINFINVGIIISVIIIPLHYFVYFSGNTSLLGNSVLYTERFGSIRFLLSPISFLFLIFLFYHYKSKFFGFSKIILILLLGILVIISKTRAFIITLLIMILLDFMYKIYKKNIKYLLQFLTFIILSLVFFNDTVVNTSSQFINILTEDVNSDNSNVSIRGESFDFYNNRMEGIDYIIGKGIENKLVANNYEERLTLSDVGIFKIVYNHGIIGVLIFIFFIYKLYQKSYKDNYIHKAIRSFALFQILVSPTIIFIYSIEGIFVNLFLYSVVNNEKS